MEASHELFRGRQFDVIERRQSIDFKDQSLLSGLPEHLLTRLFGGASTVRLKTDEVLFLAGDTGDGCYRVEDGLLKITMISRTGKERILAFLARAQSLVRCR
jgi:CRP-like cAMP-binding protein